MTNRVQLLDSIQVISEGISALNFRLADTSPSAEGFDELEKERDKALTRFHLLVKVFLKNSTRRFIQADSELAVVNEEMKEVLQELEDIQATLDNVRRFVAAIDTFLNAVISVI